MTDEDELKKLLIEYINIEKQIQPHEEYVKSFKDKIKIVTDRISAIMKVRRKMYICEYGQILPRSKIAWDEEGLDSKCEQSSSIKDAIYYLRDSVPKWNTKTLDMMCIENPELYKAISNLRVEKSMKPQIKLYKR